MTADSLSGTTPPTLDEMRAGNFVSVDICPKHGFAMLGVMSLDERGNGSGSRLLGPKRCCAQRHEVARWRMTSDEAARVIDSLRERTGL